VVDVEDHHGVAGPEAGEVLVDGPAVEQAGERVPRRDVDEATLPPLDGRQVVDDGDGALVAAVEAPGRASTV
jgi:hypothetical protein